MVTLRPLQIEDASELAILMNNRKISRNLRDIVPYPYSLADAKSFINHIKEHLHHLTFAITSQNEFVGVLGFTPEEDVYRYSIEIGYWIGEPYWKKGIGTKALNQAIDYAWKNLDVNRIHCGVYAFNTASMRLLEKCGFQKEGIFQKSVFKEGQFWDLHRYALLK